MGYECLVSMKISIITASYNSELTINNTVESLASQTHEDIEYILIDGASADNTVEIVKRYKNISLIVSEPDNGIYDAMNKGIKLATGDIVGTLNADDFYIDNSVLSEIAKIFEDDSIDACFADLVYVNQFDTSKVVRYWKSRPYKVGLFKQGWMPAHPTFFARKRVYEKYGIFDLNYKIAADFELLFRFVEQSKIKTYYLPKVLVKMRLGGTTNKNLKNIHAQNNEMIRVLRAHYHDFSALQFWWYKIINRFIQLNSRPKAASRLVS